MSESNNHRDPFKDDPDNHETITSLVQRAVQTHRQPPEESMRKRPRFPSEENRSKITLDLDADTIAALREIAQREGVGRGVSKVAQALLDYALEAYESGQLRLEMRPVAFSNRLVVVDKNDNQN
jgi:hypothetical protein